MDGRINTIKALQAVLGVTQDGIWGKVSQTALDNLVNSPAQAPEGKERGGSDQDCFKKGDNGIGLWGDDCSEGSGASCALPPDDMVAKWGSIDAAKHKLVEVAANDHRLTCVLKDRMPWKKYITNGAGIDLNPDACRELGLEPPIMVLATWKWLNA